MKDKEKELDDYLFSNKGILNPEQAKEFLRILTEEDPIRVKLGITIIKD